MDEKNYTIDIENLSVRYETADGVVEAVNGIDLKIERGKTLGLVGELSLIHISSPVSYYEEINPLMEKLAAELGYEVTYDRKPVSYTHLAETFLKENLERPGRPPLFIVVGFYGPHFPFVSDPERYEKYKKRLAGREESGVRPALEEYEDYLCLLYTSL